MGNSSIKQDDKYVLNYTNGDKYEGEVLNGQREGYGIYFYQNGDRYEGIWLKNKKHGLGNMFYKDGSMYVGQWNNSEKFGNGVYYYKSGDKYEGEFNLSKRHGKGKLSGNDGSIFEGSFFSNKKHGTGIMTFRNGKKFIEVWDNGILKSSQLQFAEIKNSESNFNNDNVLDNSFNDYIKEVKLKKESNKVSTTSLAKYFKAKIPNNYFDSIYFVIMASDLIYENPHACEWSGEYILKWLNLIGLSFDSSIDKKIKQLNGVTFIKFNVNDIITLLGIKNESQLKLITKSIDFLRIFVKLKIDYETFFVNQHKKIKEIKNQITTERYSTNTGNIESANKEEINEILKKRKSTIEKINEEQDENDDTLDNNTINKNNKNEPKNVSFSTHNNSNLNSFSFNKNMGNIEENKDELSLNKDLSFDKKIDKNDEINCSPSCKEKEKDKKMNFNIRKRLSYDRIIEENQSRKTLPFIDNNNKKENSEIDLDNDQYHDSTIEEEENEDENDEEAYYNLRTREYFITKISITKLLLHSLNISGFDFFINFDEIKLQEKIGEGGFGSVYLGTWEGKQVAIKKFHIKDVSRVKSTINKYIKEINTISSLRHPNIILYMGSTINKNECYMISEYVSRGSLFDYLHLKKQKLNEIDQISICYEMAVAIKYLHSKKILHCDLKSSNIMLDENMRVKIGDFGLSKVYSLLNEKESPNRIGTPHWMAPEIMNKKEYKESADVFSYGMIIWEILSNEIPYYGLTPNQIIGQVADFKKIVEPPSYSNISLKKLVKTCLIYDEAKRPKFDQIIVYLEHTLKKSLNHDFISDDILHFIY